MDHDEGATLAPPAPPREGEAPSVCHVVHHEGSGRVHFSRETVEGLLSGGAFFWLDLDKPVARRLRDPARPLRLPSSGVEDSEQFGQRAKIDEYDDFVFLVVYGAAPDEDDLVEVHCFYSERFLVTVHRDDCPAFEEIRRRYATLEKPIAHPSLLLYRILDGLVDSFFPILADFDDRIDELEDGIFRRPTIASSRRSSG